VLSLVKNLYPVEDITERQDEVGAINSKEKSLTILSAFVPFYGGE